MNKQEVAISFAAEEYAIGRAKPIVRSMYCVSRGEFADELYKAFLAGSQARDKEVAKLIAALKESEFTCAICSECDTCEWAWDPYNTNGDCIASK